MASPQLENGFVRIANKLYDQILGFDLSKRQLKVLLAVIRQTYGYNRSSALLTFYQVAKATGLRRDHTSHATHELAAMNILAMVESGQSAHGSEIFEWSVNKNYDTWITVPESGPVPNQDPSHNGLSTVPKTGQGPYPKRVTIKDRKTGKDKDALRDKSLSVWDVGESILGSRSHVGKLIKEHGEQAVAEAIAATSAKNPADKIPYFHGVLRNKRAMNGSLGEVDDAPY